MIRRRYGILPSLMLFFLLFAASAATAQELPQGIAGLSADRLLEEALLFSADVSVSPRGEEEELWSSKVNKITIPGRSVTVSLESGESRLKIVFTPYPSEEGRLLLVAQSETWFEGEYSSAVTSLPIEYRDEVYYYPLGRAETGTDGRPVEILVKINIVPYLETIDDETRAVLESAFDSSAQFHLSGEDP